MYVQEGFSAILSERKFPSSGWDVDVIFLTAVKNVIMFCVFLKVGFVLITHTDTTSCIHFHHLKTFFF